ncbi:hypothetical protein [Streptomyces griseorubiginosus]|uniref:hypothetical protein n=1 Tax=Streptomyces griseorubiginosus TaxID=67304 RepID=UPI002E802403|nr:hypothetical protein [Streptomyces griseorubiginosus]WUB46911.1 hypothetical protein OHN19_27695 [Streptomyces griseorubiginosus]WUB55433.1 hypothetical protein OG942_27700 [Streptomyces griseorubiginosus]
MASSRSALPTEPHPMLSGVFTDWHAKAGALSALPDAPVVTDDCGARGRMWRRLRSRLGPATRRR